MSDAAKQNEPTPVSEELPDLDDELKRQAEAFGGEVDDLDTEDFSAVDRGDSLEAPKDEEEDRGDAVAESTEEQTEDDDGEAEVSSESDSEAADESADDGDQESDSGDVEEEEDVDATEEEDEKAEKGIPRHRFNEVNERRKQAEQELAQLKAQKQAGEQAQKQEYDFDAAEAEYMELLLDGKTEQAGAKRREIREAERASFQEDTLEKTQSQQQEAAIQRELSSLSVQAERLYPIFDQNHPDFNAALTQKVVTYMQGYAQMGQSPDEAFVSGLADVVEAYDLDAKYGHVEVEEEPAPKPKVTKKAPIKKTKEKIAAAEKQAPSPAMHGKGSAERGAAVPSIENMTDEEIDALPEATLARLRGDIID